MENTALVTEIVILYQDKSSAVNVAKVLFPAAVNARMEVVTKLGGAAQIQQKEKNRLTWQPTKLAVMLVTSFGTR